MNQRPLAFLIVAMLLTPALALILSTQVEIVAASPGVDINENLWVDEFDPQEVEWSVQGTSPYLDDNEGGTDNYVFEDKKSLDVMRDFLFSDLTGIGDITSATLHIFANRGTEIIALQIWDGSSWHVVSGITTGSGWTWYSRDVSARLNTYQKVNDAKLLLMALKSGGFGDPMYVDAAYLEVDYTIPEPGQPVLLELENGTVTADMTPTFSWTAGAYADNHRIEVDNDLDWSSVLDNVTVMGNSWEENEGYSVGTYYWRVWAVNAAGENVSENVWEFTIATWWDMDWQARRKIEINPMNPENYQLRVFFENIAGMDDNLEDLRFLENVASGVLSFWVENYTTENATVWVRRLENADNAIYAYYNNGSSVQSLSSYDNTMTKDFGDSGLVLLFHMDEGSGTTAYDDNTAGGDDNGTFTGDVTWQGSDGGQWDNRNVIFSGDNHLDFGGSNDNIGVPSSASLDLDGSITVETWVKFDTRGWMTIANKRSGEEGYQLGLNDENKPNFLVSASAYGTAQGQATAPNQVTTGEWYHIVGTFNDDNDQLSIYVDGVLENYEISPDGLESPLTTLCIGNAFNGSQEIDGQLDDFRIYNRALSSEEILCHYERRKFVSPEPVTTVGDPEPPPVLPTKPVLYLPLDDDTITDETPYFEWTKGLNADNHKIEIATDNAFASIVHENTPKPEDNFHTVQNENWLSDGIYYWRVTAQSDNGENTSTTWSFTLKAISTFEDSSGVDLIWKSTNPTNKELYRVAMSENGNFIAIIDDIDGILRYFSRDENEELWNDDLVGAGKNVALSDNGYYVAASAGSTLKFYDNSGNELWDSTHEGGIEKYNVKMSGDGVYVTAGGVAANPDIVLFAGIGGNGVNVWSYRAGDRIREIAISDKTVDNRYFIAAVSHDNNIYLFDNDDNTPIWIYTTGYRPYSVDISENGQYIVVGGYDNRVYFFENSDNTPLWIYEYTDDTYFVDRHMFYRVSISDDGQYAAAGLNNGEGGYFLWSKDDNVPIWSYMGQEVRDIKVSGDGSRIVGAGWDGRYICWGNQDNVPIWVYGDIEIRPDSIAISENGSLVAGIGDDELHLLQDGSFAYDLRTEGQLRPYRVLTTTPEFSFDLPSRRAENTIAFRIQVGENVFDVENLMWNPSSIDVDFENEENEVYHTYAGIALSPYIAYQWRVRLRNNENNWSPWSVTMDFEIVERYDFPYYRTLSFTENIPDNYQVRIEIDNFSGMDENLKDLLFYDGSYSAASLPYWIENDNDGGKAIVWVKIHDNTDIRLYYGNDNAEDASYGEDTFIFFDNFPGNSVNYRKWTTGASQPAVSNGIVTLDTGNERLFTKEMYGTDLSLRVRASIANTTENMVIGFVKIAHPPYGIQLQVPGALFWGKDNNLYLRTGDVSYQLNAIVTDNNAFVSYLTVFNYPAPSPFDPSIYELKRIGTDNVELWANDDNLVLANHTEITSALVGIAMSAWTGIGSIKVDWIFIRKCLGVEPTVTVGEQENWGWGQIESWTGSIQNPAPPTVENLYITDMDNVATDNLAPETQYKFWVEIEDNDTLADIENVTLVVYLDNENLADNTTNHYTFRWTQSGGFEEVGPGGQAEVYSVVDDNLSIWHDARLQSQHKAFYTKGRFWIFYDYNIRWRTSIDGQTWSTPQTAGKTVSAAAYFSVWLDDEDNFNLFAGARYYRKGTPQENGDITWLAGWQNIGVFEVYDDPHISTDSEGYPWVSGWITDNLKTTKSSEKDGTWSTESGFPYYFDNVDGKYSEIPIPLDDNKMYIVYAPSSAFAGDENILKGRLWNNGDWGNVENVSTSKVSTSFYQMFSAASIENDVYIVFLSENENIVFMERTWGSGWGSEVVVQDNVDTMSTPTMVLDKSTDDVYVFWAKDDHHIYYKKRTSDGSWSELTDWIDESTDTLYDPDVVCSAYETYDNKILIYYVTKFSPPHNLKFAYIDLGSYDHLSPENCVLFDNTKTTDNIVFAIEFGENATVTANDNWDVWVQVYDSAGNEDSRFFLNQFDIVTGAEWNLIETWTGTVEAPVTWQEIENWTGTIEAPSEWNLIETWTGSLETPVAWQLVETWTGTIEAVSQWTLIETWSGTVQAPSVWQLIESWDGTIEAFAQWELIETWTGTVEAPSEWVLIESWSGTVQAPAAWELIETWSGTVEAPTAWNLIETWSGTAEAFSGWSLLETWSGTIEAISGWELMETWDGTVEAPSEWQQIESWTGTIEAPSEWTLIESWTGTAIAPVAWELIESWTVTIEAFSGWQLLEEWTGTVEAFVGWQLLETWTGVIEAVAGWELIESWNGTVQAPSEWLLLETWTGTIEASTAWQLISTWTGTVQAPSVWDLIESWSGTVQAPSEWSEIENWSGGVIAVGWTLIETWGGTVRAPGWLLTETWTGGIRTPDVYAVSISITPAENSGTLGDTLTYTVTVVNIGGTIDNYDITSNDPQGWAAYPDDNVILNVAYSASGSTTLNVGLSTLGTHTINVTATSQGDGMVSDTASTTAISATAGEGHPGGVIGGGSVALGIAALAVGLAVVALVFILMRRREEEAEAKT